MHDALSRMGDAVKSDLRMSRAKDGAPTSGNDL